MKYRVTFKTPDAAFDVLNEVSDDVEHHKLEQLLMKFIQWDEYLTVEFDTEAKTATVIEKAKAG